MFAESHRQHWRAKICLDFMPCREKVAAHGTHQCGERQRMELLSRSKPCDGKRTPEQKPNQVQSDCFKSCCSRRFSTLSMASHRVHWNRNRYWLKRQACHFKKLAAPARSIDTPSEGGTLPLDTTQERMTLIFSGDQRRLRLSARYRCSLAGSVRLPRALPLHRG